MKLTFRWTTWIVVVLFASGCFDDFQGTGIDGGLVDGPDVLGKSVDIEGDGRDKGDQEPVSRSVEAPPVPEEIRTGPHRDYFIPAMCDAVGRTMYGALDGGTLVVRVRARIAQSASGEAATTEARVRNDIDVLNRVVFRGTNISFRLDEVERLPANDVNFYDRTRDVWGRLCDGNATGLRVGERALWLDSLPLVYVGTITGTSGFERGTPAGYGGGCGIVLSSGGLSLDPMRAAEGGATYAHVLGHEVGHFLELMHTFECREDSSDRSDQHRNGDQVSDTPTDPGPDGEPLECYPNGRSPGESPRRFTGSCRQQAGACTVTCFDRTRAPDGRNYMSYYRPSCMDSYSAEQIQVMRCVLATARTSILGCPEGQSRCGGVCVALMTDRANCGECGRRCAEWETCEAGACTCSRGCPGVCECRDGDGDGLYATDCMDVDCAQRTDCDDTRRDVLPGAIEVCNGVDDDCDGMTDEGIPDLTCGTGACQRTTPACVGGTANRCLAAAPGVETCNGVDDDCDGMTDEDLPDLACGVGVCARTEPACVMGRVNQCEPGTPVSEVCNGLDDDCDGMADEGLPDLRCGTGVCNRTAPACVAGVPGACVPGDARTEVCNGVDDNCDGMTDEGFGATTCGVGACRRTTSDCMGGETRTCTPGSPSSEVCNGVDDDCDGTADEDLGTVSCGVGECRRTVAQCAGGSPQTCVPGNPQNEACNGRDDDCDGATDEGLGETTCGVGACRRIVDNCVDGTVRVCAPGAPGAESCNGRDDDCDGAVDEGLGTTSCGTGYCRRTVDNCVGGASQTCVPGPSRAEVCNGVDDDCDGAVDEDLGTTSCGTGECRRTIVNCVGGVSQTCVPGPSRSEVCNGRDDDCDGVVDDGVSFQSSCGTGYCRRTVSTCVAGVPQVCVPGPSRAETCNGVDDDCDGDFDEDPACVTRHTLPAIANLFPLDPTGGDREFNSHGPVVEVTVSTIPPASSRPTRPATTGIVIRACVTMTETTPDHTRGSRCENVTTLPFTHNGVVTGQFRVVYTDTDHGMDNAITRATSISSSNMVRSVTCVGDTDGNDICSNRTFESADCSGCRLGLGFIEYRRVPPP